MTLARPRVQITLCYGLFVDESFPPLWIALGVEDARLKPGEHHALPITWRSRT